MRGQPIQHLKRYEIQNQPRFLTFSCYQRLALFNNDRIKNQFVNQLRISQSRLSFNLLAWVVMPEHVHLLLVPDLPQTTATSVLAAIKRDFARSVISRWRELNAPIMQRITGPNEKARFWQKGGGYDRNIRDESELREKCDYIYNNPCKRGLAKAPCEWKWSSARYFAGLTDDILEV